MVKKSPTKMCCPPLSREQGVAVEAADRRRPVERAGIGDELGVVGEAGLDRVGVVGGDTGEVGAGDVGGFGHGNWYSAAGLAPRNSAAR